MRKQIGVVVQVIGWLASAWCVVVGGSFSLIYAMGFIGTSGREAGGELVVMLALTIGGALAGYLVAKLGLRIAHPDPPGPG